MKQRRKYLKSYGTYTTTAFSESNTKSKEGGSNSMSLQSRPLLTASEIQLINRPHSLVMFAGKDPAIFNAPDLSKWIFNSCLGLGTEKHNNEVRKVREALRDKKEINSIKLKIWDIAEHLQREISKEQEEKRQEKELARGMSNNIMRKGIF
jgi:uncharacterized protein YgfB (UPF0149 family)